jgi:formylglycine-generating enzyme required for sulfatase activity
LFAQKAWKKAFQAGQEYEHEADGRKANIAPDLNRKISALRDFFTAEKFKEKKQVKQAMAFYAEAISFAPEMDIAKKEFDKLEKLKLSCDKLLKDAKDAVVKGIEQDDDYTKAKEYWDKAIAFAEKLVEKKVHTIEAKKIIKETNWRLDAGEGMVLVIISSRLAIAVDRYEYPNKKGSIPKAVAFHEARQIAASLGKKLPSEDEWRMLFKDRDRFAWGDAFDASRVNCSVTNTSNDPVACGSLKSGASREGIFELCGNMAEWLDNGEGENAQEASAVGGSFISKDENEIQLLSVKYHSAILVSPNIGFRCIKVYK